MRNDPAVFHARVMPALISLDEDDALDLAVNITHHLLRYELTSVSGNGVRFNRFSWAIFKGRTDPSSAYMEKHHDKAAGDDRLRMTETPDQNDAALTRVDIELR